LGHGAKRLPATQTLSATLRRCYDLDVQPRLGPPLLYGGTVVGLGVAARAALGHPPTLPTALGFLGAYLGLVAAGVFRPSLGMFGEVLCSVPGGRGVALSFDDGPDPVHTARVLDGLRAREAKATFFVVGERAERHPALIERMLAEGHAIGSHGQRVDPWLGFRGIEAVRDDLGSSVRVLSRLTGKAPTMFRPPYGVLNPRITRAAEELDLDIVCWNVRGLDGVARTTADALVTRVVPRLRDGNIVCLHDAAERGDRVPVAPSALPRLLAAAADLQLDVVTIPALARSVRSVDAARNPKKAKPEGQQEG
jgi:peptidoglycan-N-acetylglucosamine deacetylase